MPVETRFETEIKEAKLRILEMAGLVEQSLEHASRALSERDSGLLEVVDRLENKVNQAHKDIDNTCLGVLARLAPVAVDLRMVLAIVKINTDLERMGDQAVNVSKNIRHYLSQEPLSEVREFTKMVEMVRSMVRDALDSFVNDDVALARKVLESDDAVDDFKRRFVNKMKEKMSDDPGAIEAALNLILMARNFERIADHATNIAEEVIFIRTGDDIRHGGGKASGGKRDDAE